MKKIFPLLAASLFLLSTSCSFDIVSLSIDDAERLIQDSVVQILDVRTPQEFSASHIDGAINIDLYSELFDEFAKSYLDKARPVLVYCAKGSKSKVAAEKLEVLDFNPVYDMGEGLNAWIADGKPVVTSDDVLKRGFSDLNEVCDFIQNCGYYMLAVMVGDTVAHMRPFTNLAVYDGKFYIMANNKDRLKMITKINPRVEICAYSPKNTSWIRIFGYLREEKDIEIRSAIIDNGEDKNLKVVNTDNTDVFYLENIKGKYTVFGVNERFLEFKGE